MGERQNVIQDFGTVGLPGYPRRGEEKASRGNEAIDHPEKLQVAAGLEVIATDEDNKATIAKHLVEFGLCQGQ